MSGGIKGRLGFFFDCQDRWSEEILRIEKELAAKNAERRKLRGRSRTVILNEIVSLEKKLRLLHVERDLVRGKKIELCRKFRCRRRRLLNQNRRDSSRYYETFSSIEFLERMSEEFLATPTVARFCVGEYAEE